MGGRPPPSPGAFFHLFLPALRTLNHHSVIDTFLLPTFPFDCNATLAATSPASQFALTQVAGRQVWPEPTAAEPSPRPLPAAENAAGTAATADPRPLSGEEIVPHGHGLQRIPAGYFSPALLLFSDFLPGSSPGGRLWELSDESA